MSNSEVLRPKISGKVNVTWVSSLVAEQGLVYLGMVPLTAEPYYAYFSRWLDRGKHGNLRYLERHQELRSDPRRLFPNAQSAVVLGLPYQGNMARGDIPAVAGFVLGEDYHRILRRKMKAVISRMQEVPELKSMVARCFVDSAPILERALAARTSDGFIGKNNLFVHPQWGSFVLLGEIVTSLSVDEPAIEPVPENHPCGTCDRCLRACPSGALEEPFCLDVNKCLAYWSMEHVGLVPEHIWPLFSRWYFGCDACQVVCPYNKPNVSDDFLAAPLEFPPLPDLVTMTDVEFVTRFAKTAAGRVGRSRLRRNALIAMTVSSHPALGRVLDEAVSDIDPVVRATAAEVRSYRKIYSFTDP